MPSRYLTVPPVTTSAPKRADVELDRADRLVAVGEDDGAVRMRGLGDRGSRRAGARSGRRARCSRPARCGRRSRRRSARAEIDPSASGRTCTTSAPRSSCACAIWPTVGNSYSLITIRLRPPSSRSAETSALTPCDTEVVTATSSGGGVHELRERGTGALVLLHPEVPLRAVRVPPVEPRLDRLAHAVAERALRARVQVRRRLEDGELAADRGADARVDRCHERSVRELYRRRPAARAA